jgi:hypothetical protein
METKFELIETSDYILAVSDEKIKKGDFIVLTNNEIIEAEEDDSFPKRKCKIIAYQPKSNAVELDLPLLPEMVVEPIGFGEFQYTEEDLRKAIELTILNCIVDTIGYDNHVVSFEGNVDEIIQSIKQPKTPKMVCCR